MAIGVVAVAHTAVHSSCASRTNWEGVTATQADLPVPVLVRCVRC